VATPELVVDRPARGGRVIGARRALASVALTAVLANATWFSATAVVPALEHDWGLSAAGAAWLVVVVQLGFIAGSIGSALLNLPDRLEPRRLIASSAVVAAVANAGLLVAGGLGTALPSRFLVGVALAGVYAPGVRLVATYFERGRGVATGIVVGALTLGSATPHLVRGVGHVPWQATIATTSGVALLAAVAMRSVPTGPLAPAVPPLDLGAALRALRDGPVRLTTLGYLGHMWELYALWAWLPAFFVASRHAAPGRLLTGAVAFAAIGVAGLLGAVAAGHLADRFGRTATTSGAMVVSAALLPRQPRRLRRADRGPRRHPDGVGRVRDRRLGAVLGRRDRARRAPLRRLGADPAARTRLRAHDPEHPARARGGRRRRLALRPPRACRRPAERHRRHAPASGLARLPTSRGRTPMTGLRLPARAGGSGPAARLGAWRRRG
jgi:MFS family permease